SLLILWRFIVPHAISASIGSLEESALIEPACDNKIKELPLHHVIKSLSELSDRDVN
ncbi:hypothetical protein J6590_019288, partial [Homalodisca vitripennis]